MNQLIQLLLSNFTTISLAVGLGIIIITNNTLGRKTNVSFLILILLVLVLNVSEIIDFYLSGFSETPVLRYITSATGYTLRPASIAILISILLRRKKLSIVLWMPIVFTGAIAFTSNLTHLMFWFDSLNRFQRGTFGFLPHIVSGLYCIVLIILTVKMHRNITSGEIFVIIFMTAISVTATIIESTSSYKFLVTGAIMVSCTLYYLTLYMETYKRDPLTGLLNRRSFYNDARKMHGRQIAVISADMNNLKEINDLQGHSAGDQALKNMADAMQIKSDRNFRAYRTGGDEYMALGVGASPEQIETYITDIKVALSDKNLTASFGSAIYNPSDNFDSICNLADAQMYNDKMQYKHRTSTRG